MAYNTGNPVPSTDAKDFVDNCENLDKAVNSLEPTFQDRLGVTRSTYEGVVQGLSFFNVGTFTVGFTLTNSRQTLTYDGHEYGWSGAFPKVVNAGSTPTPLGSGGWIDRSDVTLRGNLAEMDGTNLIGGATYAQIRAYAGAAERIKCLGRSNIFDGAYGEFVLDAGDTTTLDDDGICIVDSVGRRWKRQLSGPVNVIWYGAKPNDSSQAVALANTAAFRSAFLSLKSKFDAARTAGTVRSVFVPDGDWDLSNGFTVPMGVSLKTSGKGNCRISLKSANVDANPALQLVTVGGVIEADLSTVSVNQSQIALAAPPEIDDLWVNPTAGRTGVRVICPGFHIKSLWTNAATGIDFSGCADGIVDEVFLEDGTLTGMAFSGAQNLLIGKVYSYLNNFTISNRGGNNNIRIDSLQVNYPKINAIICETSNGNDGISIGHMMVQQNEQFSTYTGAFRFASQNTKMAIDVLELRNLKGPQFICSAAGNELSIGKLICDGNKLKSSYSQSTDMTLLPSTTSNLSLTIDSGIVRNLHGEPITMAGSGNVVMMGPVRFTGNAGNQSISQSAGTLVIDGTDGGGKDLLVRTGGTLELYNPKNWLTVKDDGTYWYVSLPSAHAISYDVSSAVAVNSGANGNYVETKRFNIDKSVASISSVVTSKLTATNISTSDSGGAGVATYTSTFSDGSTQKAGTNQFDTILFRVAKASQFGSSAVRSITARPTMLFNG